MDKWGLRYILSPLVRLVPVAGIFSLPLCDWIAVAGISPGFSAQLQRGPAPWGAATTGGTA
eukprot:1473143-Pyramimonas_sp.AAC.1